jgi:hypothetical protein
MEGVVISFCAFQSVNNNLLEILTNHTYSISNRQRAAFLLQYMHSSLMMNFRVETYIDNVTI